MWVQVGAFMPPASPQWSGLGVSVLAPKERLLGPAGSLGRAYWGRMLGWVVILGQPNMPPPVVGTSKNQMCRPLIPFRSTSLHFVTLLTVDSNRH